MLSPCLQHREQQESPGRTPAGSGQAGSEQQQKEILGAA